MTDRLVLQQLCQAEIEYLYLPRFSHHYITGLNIAVNYILRMREGERIRDLDRYRQRAS